MGLILSLLFATSLFVRSFGLTQSPPELFGDEVDVGYQARSLLQTGRDLYSQPLPIYLHSLSEWRTPVLMYATVPSIWLLGNSVWGVRLPEVVFGSLAPLLLLILVYETSKSKPLAILASLVLALTPWHIHYSRSAFEVVLMTDLLLLGVISFQKKLFALCSLLFALTLYTYSTAVVFTPLFLLFNFRKPKVILIFAVLSLPLLYQIFFGHASERFSLLTIANQPEILSNISAFRLADPQPSSLVFHNKYESTATTVLNNYLRSFSTEFLFVRGDNILRHNSPNMGEFLPLTFPFFILGVWALFSRQEWLWIWWLLLAPVPSALTWDGGTHATRLFLMVVPVTVAIAYGLMCLPKKISLPMLLILLIQLVLWFHFYLNHYPTISWRWWHYGYRQAFSDLAKYSPQYSRVFINNTYEPSLIRFLFWTNYPPRIFQKNFVLDQRQPNIAPYYDGFKLGSKYYFGTFSATGPTNMSQRLMPDSLYLVSHREEGIPYDTRILTTISDPLGNPLFYLVDKKP